MSHMKWVIVMTAAVFAPANAEMLNEATSSLLACYRAEIAPLASGPCIDINELTAVINKACDFEIGAFRSVAGAAKGISVLPGRDREEFLDKAVDSFGLYISTNVLKVRHAKGKLCPDQRLGGTSAD